ncbi:MAG TPA: hypothetical protein EYP14_01005 [Planctomycetaceae bacterium]|nr:hypothetical protein [Planctomycetaceae bacterium]
MDRSDLEQVKETSKDHRGCKPHEPLVDRSDSPWDDADRRPSQANRRKAFRSHLRRTDYVNIRRQGPLPPKIARFVGDLIPMAA